MVNLPTNLPALLREILGQADVLHAQETRLGAGIFNLRTQAGTETFLKMALKESEEDLAAEVKRLKWLKGKLPVADVLFWGSDATRDYVLLSQLEGRPSHDPLWQSDLPRLMRSMAKGLRQIHQLPLVNCPFTGILDQELQEAERRIVENRLDLSGFLKASEQRSPQEVLGQLHQRKHCATDLVFTHGDFCMPNILVKNWKINGYVDWAIAGISDRHRDLMCVLDSVEHNCGAEALPFFFEEYGLAEVDMAKIAFFRDLDLFYSDFG